MFYVVIREIECITRDVMAFRQRRKAHEAYDEAARVCDNGPDDGPGDDPTIVTNCWLGWVDTPDPEIAERLALSGYATMLKRMYS